MAGAKVILSSNPLRRAFATVTTGDITLPNTGGVWTSVGLTLSIPAAVGDWVEVSVSALKTRTANVDMDIAVSVSGSLVWFASSGGAVPSVDGLPDWYWDGAFLVRPAPAMLQVEAGHISGGTVTFAIATNALGVGTLFASANYPFRWRIFNYGPI